MFYECQFSILITFSLRNTHTLLEKAENRAQWANPLTTHACMSRVSISRKGGKEGICRSSYCEAALAWPPDVSPWNPSTGGRMA